MPFFDDLIGPSELSYTRTAPTMPSGRDASAKRLDSDVQARIDRLSLACEAMWTLLRDKLGVDNGALLDRMTQLDAADGKIDGKAGKTALSCPSCGRTIARRFPKCIYCGQGIEHDPFA